MTPAISQSDEGVILWKSDGWVRLALKALFNDITGINFNPGWIDCDGSPFQITEQINERTGEENKPKYISHS